MATETGRYYAVRDPAGQPTGQYAPSVTSVTRLLDKSGLLRWYAEQAIRAAVPDLWGLGFRQGQEDPIGRPGQRVSLETFELVQTQLNYWLEQANQLSNQAKDIGTYVHKGIAGYHQGLPHPEIWHLGRPEANLEEDLVQAYLKEWLYPSVSRIIWVERAVSGGIMTEQGRLCRYGGTLDLFCELQPGAIIRRTEKQVDYLQKACLAVVDIKVSGDFYDEYGLQLGGYGSSREVANFLDEFDQTNGHEAPTELILLNVRLDKDKRRTYVKQWDRQRWVSAWESCLALWFELHPDACERYAKQQARGAALAAG